MKKTRFTTRNVAIASILGILAVIAAALVAVSFFYSTHALPGASVAGEPVGGLTRDQVTADLQGRLGEETLVLEGAVNPVEVPLADAGVEVNIPATVDEVFAPNRGLVTRMTGLFGSRDVMPVVSVNEDQLEQLVGTLQGEGLRPVKDGAVVFDEAQQVFIVQEAQPGSAVDTGFLSSEIARSTQAMTFVPIAVTLVDVVPTHDSEDAQRAADKANQFLANTVALRDREDILHEADLDSKVSWVDFENEDGVITPVLDQKAVKAWVEEHSAESNLEAQARVENVNSAGTVLSVSYDGTDGFVADNSAPLTEGIVAAFQDSQPFEGVVEYSTEERAVQQRLIADGAENLAYPAAPGEKWIDISLSNYTVTAYEGATPVMSSPMVPGAPATPTITGQYNVWAKVPVQTMRGNNADGTKYETPDVPWILYFHGGYATHGAYWRSNFGYDAGPSGSHGCVNMPVGNAKALYDWANVGTKVVSHY